MKLNLVAIALGVSAAVFASPRAARAQSDRPMAWPGVPPPPGATRAPSYPWVWWPRPPEPPPSPPHGTPRAAVAVALPLAASLLPPGAGAGGFELSTLIRAATGHMLGLTFAFARSIGVPDSTHYNHMPDVHRSTDVALDLRYEARFGRPDAIVPWVSGGAGPFLRIAEGSGTVTRSRRIGFDMIRAEGGFDTRTEPLSVGLFAQVRLERAPECRDDDLAYSGDFCPEGGSLDLWLGGGLRVVLSGE